MILPAFSFFISAYFFSIYCCLLHYSFSPQSFIIFFSGFCWCIGNFYAVNKEVKHFFKTFTKNNFEWVGLDRRQLLSSDKHLCFVFKKRSAFRPVNQQVPDGSVRRMPRHYLHSTTGRIQFVVMWKNRSLQRGRRDETKGLNGTIRAMDSRWLEVDCNAKLRYLQIFLLCKIGKMMKNRCDTVSISSQKLVKQIPIQTGLI